MRFPPVIGQMTVLEVCRSLGVVESPVVDARFEFKHRVRLLRLARAAAGRRLGNLLDSEARGLPVKGRCGGVFVTLWEGKTLRGCVGTFAPSDDIGRTVEEVTESALADPRFISNPVKAQDLPNLRIELSILGDAVRVGNPLTLIPGVHGVMIRRGDKSGCFLPKVAVDRGWSVKEFLSNCCTMKAQLPADAWRHADTEVFLFTAESFAESEPA